MKEWKRKSIAKLESIVIQTKKRKNQQDGEDYNKGTVQNWGN